MAEIIDKIINFFDKDKQSNKKIVSHIFHNTS